MHRGKKVRCRIDSGSGIWDIIGVGAAMGEAGEGSVGCSQLGSEIQLDGGFGLNMQMEKDICTTSKRQYCSTFVSRVP